ncbi:MAG: hypothetical protein IPN76_30665 [Saprospiraceae bacterium]|nr:hypothetical protein [Saprospiraceae bacterium]
MPKVNVLAILFSFLPLFAAAQKADFRLYTVSDGLPQNSVYSIAQDTQGFIWANAGMRPTRFDGAKFLSHSNSKHPIFHKDRGNFQQIQADGELLVYCIEGHIGSINTRTGEETAVPVAGRLPAGYDANNGHCLKLGNGEIVAIYPAQAAGKVAVFWLQKGKIARMVEVSGVVAGRENFYTMVCGDGLGNLYFVSQGHDAILKFSPKGEKLQSMPYEKNLTLGITRLVPGQRNSVFLTFGNAIQRLEQGADAFQPHPASRLIQIGRNSIYDLVETPQGNLWLACSDKHLVFYDAKQDRVLDYRKELETIIQNQTTFFKLTLDKSGAIWATSSVGLLKLMPNTPLFDTYFTEQHVLCGGYCSFRGFAEDEEGSVYASFYNNIFQISPAKGRQSIYSPLLPFDYGPFDLLFFKGKLLLNSGKVFDLTTRQLINPYQSTLNYIDYGAFASDAKGGLWRAVQDKVYKLDGAQGAPVWKEITNILIKGAIEDIVFDPPSGRLWFGGGAMLWSLDPVTEQFKRFGENEPDMLTGLKCIHPDGKGSLWLGTEKGLVHLDYGSGKWRRYTQSEGLPNDIVVGMLPEGDSCLWLSTFNGLSRFSIGSGRFLNFYKQDGLADNEFNRASFFKASDGRMFFGGVKGVTAFYPEKVMAQNARLQGGGQLLLRSVSMTEEGSDTILNRVFHAPGQVLDVYYRNKTVSIEYGLLGGSKDGQTLFSYLLDGQDETWSTPSANSSVTFTSLPSGNYTFRVKALDARGHWISEEIALPLTVHPPWWASWWAYLLYALALAGIAYGVFYFLKKRLELQSQLQLEQQAALRGSRNWTASRVGSSPTSRTSSAHR